LEVYDGNRQGEIPRSVLLKVVSFPRKRESSSSGTWNPAPRLRGDKLRGGDALTFKPLGGPQAHDHSE
jgi:hypothetical protein